MKNLKPLLPIIAILYALNSFYYAFFKGLLNENSYIRHVFQRLADGRFRNIDAMFFRTLVSWILIGVLIAGVIKYFKSEDKRVNRLLEFGLIYQALSTLFYIPVSISYLAGQNQHPGSGGPTTLWYIQYPIYFVCAILVCIYFSKQIKTFQRPPFGAREKSYGPTPYKQYLDSGNLSTTKWIRFKNYFLDGIFIYLLAFGAVTQMITTYFGNSAFSYASSSLGFRLVFILALFIYYLVMEAIFGKTLGKIITGTAVQFYGKSSFTGAIGRTFCRLIPFEPFSFFFKNGYGWHDEFSQTSVEKISLLEITNDLIDHSELIS